MHPKASVTRIDYNNDNLQAIKSLLEQRCLILCGIMLIRTAGAFCEDRISPSFSMVPGYGSLFIFHLSPQRNSWFIAF